MAAAVGIPVTTRGDRFSILALGSPFGSRGRGGRVQIGGFHVMASRKKTATKKASRKKAATKKTRGKKAARKKAVR